MSLGGGAPLIRVCAVMCQPVYSRVQGSGYIIVKRVGRPVPGGWALPGGWVENGETFEAAAAREFREETGLQVDPPRILWSYLSDDKFPIIFCKGESPVSLEWALESCKLQDREVSQLSWTRGLDSDHPMCFSTHTHTLRRLLGY